MRDMERLYRALGMAVALAGCRTQASVTDDARIWSGLIRNFAELSDQQISEIQEAAAGSLKPGGSVTSLEE